MTQKGGAPMGIRNIQHGDFTVILSQATNGFHAEVLHHGSWIGSVFTYSEDETLLCAGQKIAAHLSGARPYDSCGPRVCADKA